MHSRRPLRPLPLGRWSEPFHPLNTHTVFFKEMESSRSLTLFSFMPCSKESVTWNMTERERSRRRGKDRASRQICSWWRRPRIYIELQSACRDLSYLLHLRAVTLHLDPLMFVTFHCFALSVEVQQILDNVQVDSDWSTRHWLITKNVTQQNYILTCK